ncbi:globin domain-containing protein [Candidatus Frankia nodulisporulans]|uniref:globin domain-containing protein n=1 Tax=Candidatus Frankia nodulisporulans TaxID=2060052 RepID=UPI0013D5CDBD|nr:globin domain-containing protein [Candidatus Frankia nodulisporulans]
MSAVPTEQSAAVLRATAGVVAEHAEQISAVFYRRLLSTHPRVAPMFSRSGQASGAQQRALAAALVAFTEHLLGEPRSPFDAVVRRIAHRHASLGVAPEQYPLVGRQLLAAVAEVLGDAVTPRVHDAWDEAYWLFATALVAEEARAYQRMGTDPARPWRPWRVTARTVAAPEVVSFDLLPTGLDPLPTFRPGQYVTVAVDLPDGGRQARPYSLSRAPGSGSLRITVRRVPAVGTAPQGVVSAYLHEQVKVGDVLDVSPPAGDVTLTPGTDPLVLVSAGIGITPMIAMMGHTARLRPQRTVVAAHADRSPEHHPLRAEMLEIGALLRDFQLHTRYEPHSPVQIDVDALPLPEGARVYLCGPLPFMRDVRAGLLRRGLSPDHIRYEIFGPDPWAGNPT